MVLVLCKLIFKMFLWVFLTLTAIKANELKETNVSTFLPYKLKVEDNKEAKDASGQHVNALDNNEFKEKPTLNRYEDSKVNSILPESNSWKRLTTFLPTHAPTIGNQPDFKHFCKSPAMQFNSVFGPFQYVLVQIVFLTIHLAVLTYILFTSLALFHRLVSLSSAPYLHVQSANEDLNNQLYKREFREAETF